MFQNALVPLLINLFFITKYKYNNNNYYYCLTFHSLIQRLLKKKNFILTCSFSDIGSKKCFIEKPSGHDVFKLNMKCVTLDVEKIKKIHILTLTY